MAATDQSPERHESPCHAGAIHKRSEDGAEWQARKHGAQGRRQWRKIHLAMDTATSDIRAVEFTPSRDGDSPVLPDLLDQILDDEPIGTVTADGAYDTSRCHATIIERQATAIIPIRKTGRPDDPGKRMGRQLPPATTSSGPHGTSDAPSGNAGPATTSAAVS